MKQIIMTVTAAALLSSCGLYKNYERPQDIITDGLYKTEQTQDSLGMASLSWKEVFTDPQLQTLIEKGLAQNTDMRSAQLQIEQAEASLMAAKWAYVPSLPQNVAVKVWASLKLHTQPLKPVSVLS